MVEEWKRIIETNKNYEVSNLGRVRNGDTGKILTPRATATGYLRVHISVPEGGRKDFYIHRLVAEAFCPRQEGCNIINHLDNNPSNNIASNLEWTTQKENLEYAQAQDRMPNWQKKRPVIGFKDGQSYYFESIQLAAKTIGVHSTDISKCCKGTKDNTNGYYWQYAEG